MIATSRPLCVLIVDDSEDTVVSCGELLKLYGHDVRTAQSGAEALEILEDWEPDVILSDIRMPGMDGNELARRICERATGSPLLVAITGVSDATARQQAKTAGYDYFLVKPVNPDLLTDLLRAYSVTLNITSGKSSHSSF
jgi:CheY-like chemotaxis protein